MEDNKFNCYSLTDKEFEKVIKDFMPTIINRTREAGEMQEDCIQDIIISLHHTLTRNR